MKKVLMIAGLVTAGLVIVVVSLAVIGDIKPIFIGLHSPVSESNGKVLDGFDVVSYFHGKPLRGSGAHSYTWNGGTWLFSSQENLNAFKRTPEAFVPQFGGYCTFAVSTGFTAPGDPTVYAIRENKLFIFADGDAKSEFLQNPDGLIASCQKHWNK